MRTSKLVLLLLFSAAAIQSCNKAEPLKLDSAKNPKGFMIDVLFSVATTNGKQREVEEKGVVPVTIRIYDPTKKKFQTNQIIVTRCSVGQDLTDPECTGNAQEIEFCFGGGWDCDSDRIYFQQFRYRALSSGNLFYACETLNWMHGNTGFAGITDWRLMACPDYGYTVDSGDRTDVCELFQFYKYFLDHQSEFPNTPEGQYWSSSSWLSFNSALAIDFKKNSTNPKGDYTNPYKGEQHFVRCVSGPPPW
ncbi:hypothetical protein CH373_04950 [Leptospira perolatii]|uniref:DUF1566 domain-containing protein n=1 Tax=Leptospira perolatii TaxID=2023191 RepID=A0A2M9ZQN0_9LEPT|nr:DUF1566 domain-containing protein [Leptospira perolatii]PJZ70425.1 hypothetical protein CH360_05370 [Leptospira perolatii]PJZ74261.1 hypothetical protein CH373_04950 [Leptospira perolatii]